MILDIKQIAADGKNLFEISENGQVLFKASAPFYKPFTPIGGEAFRSLSLTDISGKEILRTYYDAGENLKESAIPLSWLFKSSKKVRRYTIYDSNDRLVGAFYYEQSGAADTKLVIEYGADKIVCYQREAGKKEVVSFYIDDAQVGQVTKPNCVLDNLDRYLAHFTAGFPYREIISLFVVYYDFLYHNHSGEISKGWRADNEYTFDKNSKKYNKKFIAENFGDDENERVERFIKDTYAARKRK